MHRSTIPLSTSRSMANAAASTTRQQQQPICKGYPSVGNCRGSPQTHQYNRSRSSPERRQSKQADEDDGEERSSGRCTPVPQGTGPEPFEYPSNPIKQAVVFERGGSATYRVLTPRNGSPVPTSSIPSGPAFVGGRIIRPSSARGNGGAKAHRFVIVASPPPIPPSLVARRRQDQQSHKPCAKIVVTPPSPMTRAIAIHNVAS